MHTLVIIDMQPIFQASKKPSVLRNVLSLIKKTKENKGAIVVIEYAGGGPGYKIYKCISKAIGIYRKTISFKKYNDAGGKLLHNHLRKNHFPQHNLWVCGVNTDCCVHDTIKQYLRVIPKELKEKTEILVFESACNTDESCDLARDIFKPNKNLKVISRLR